MPYVPDHLMQGGSASLTPPAGVAPNTMTIQPTAGAPATAQGVQQAAGQEPAQAPQQAPPQAPPLASAQEQPFRLSGNPFAPQLAQQVPQVVPGQASVSQAAPKMAGACSLQKMRSVRNYRRKREKKEQGFKYADRLFKNAGGQVVRADTPERRELWSWIERMRHVARENEKNAENQVSETAEQANRGDENMSRAADQGDENMSRAAKQGLHPRTKSASGGSSLTPTGFSGGRYDTRKLANVLRLFNMERSGTGQGTKKPKIAPKWYREGEEAFLDPKELYYKRSKPRNGLHTPLGSNRKTAEEMSLPETATTLLGAGLGGFYGADKGDAIGTFLAGEHIRPFKTQQDWQQFLSRRKSLGNRGALLGGLGGLLLGGYGGLGLANLWKQHFPGGASPVKQADLSMLAAVPLAGAGVGAAFGAGRERPGRRMRGAIRGAGMGLGGVLGGGAGMLGGLYAGSQLEGTHPALAKLLSLGIGFTGMHLGGMAGGRLADKLTGDDEMNEESGGLLSGDKYASFNDRSLNSLEKDAFIPQLIGYGLRGLGTGLRATGGLLRGGGALARGAGRVLAAPGKAMAAAGRGSSAAGKMLTGAGSDFVDLVTGQSSGVGGLLRGAAGRALAAPTSAIGYGLRGMGGLGQGVGGLLSVPGRALHGMGRLSGAVGRGTSAVGRAFDRGGKFLLNGPAPQVTGGANPLGSALAGGKMLPPGASPTALAGAARGGPLPSVAGKVVPPPPTAISTGIPATPLAASGQAPLRAIPVGSAASKARWSQSLAQQQAQQAMPGPDPIQALVRRRMGVGPQTPGATPVDIAETAAYTPGNAAAVSRPMGPVAPPPPVPASQLNRVPRPVPAAPRSPATPMYGPAAPMVSPEQVGIGTPGLRPTPTPQSNIDDSLFGPNGFFNPKQTPAAAPTSPSGARVNAPGSLGMMNDDMDSAAGLEVRASVKEALDKLDPFALGFLDRCLEKRLSGPQIKRAAVKASKVHPEVAELLAPFTKQAVWPWLAQMTAKAAPAAGRLLGWGAKAKSMVAPAVQTAKNFAARPGVNAAYQTVRNPVAGALTGGSLGYGVDSIGDLTGLYDTDFATYGALLGGGMRMPGMRRLLSSTGPLARMGGAGRGLAARGRQMQQFFTGGGLGKAQMAGAGGMAQKALGNASMFLGPMSMGKQMGQEAFQQGMDDFAQQHGMTPEELGQMASMLNSGDYLGLMQHGWGKLDPKTQMMIMGGLGLGGLGLAGAATGNGGLGAMAGLGGLGLLGAGLYQGGQRMGAFGGGAAPQGQPGMPPQQAPGAQAQPQQVAHGVGPQQRNELALQQGLA